MRPIEFKAQQLWEGEVLKDRYDIGEGLVERWNVDVCLLLIETVDPVEQRVRRFVRNHIVGKTSKNQLSVAGRAAAGEISEQQCPLVGTVICVRLA